MSDGELWTRWTVRVALIFYFSSLAQRMRAGRQSSAAYAHGRVFWTLGSLVFLAHMAAAFQFYHGWSHTAAYEATARQSEQVVGLAWGGGLWANYVFALVWLGDAAWWWLSPTSYGTRSRFIEFLVQGFLAFIAFNATVVFGQGAIRWWGLAATILLAAIFLFTVFRPADINKHR